MREKTLVEAIASSLTELFSPAIIGERMAGMLAHYDFVSRETLVYFDKRPPQAERDSGFALAYVKANARTPEDQQRVLAALEFKFRRVVGDARRAVLCLCRAEARAVRRLRPGGVVNDVPMISDDARPRLRRGVRLTNNEAQGGWVLLAPERVFKADQVTAEILKRCTGDASLGCIVDDLAQTFTGAPRERIQADVAALLGSLLEKRLLELA